MKCKLADMLITVVLINLFFKSLEMHTANKKNWPDSLHG